jgi:plastocyanin
MAVGVIVALVLAQLAGAAEAPKPPAGAERGTAARVRIVDNRYRPRTITVEAGTRVRWSNAGRNSHSVTADDRSFDSGLLAPGDRFARRFRRPGSYPFHCTVHPRMTGTIRVV